LLLSVHMPLLAQHHAFGRDSVEVEVAGCPAAKEEFFHALTSNNDQGSAPGIGHVLRQPGVHKAGIGGLCEGVLTVIAGVVAKIGVLGKEVGQSQIRKQRSSTTAPIESTETIVVGGSMWALLAIGYLHYLRRHCSALGQKELCVHGVL
jgi:hypothetical protein